MWDFSACWDRRSWIRALAEEAALRDDCEMLELTSKMRRAEAHALHEKLGFDRSSYRFEKMLAE